MKSMYNNIDEVLEYISEIGNYDTGSAMAMVCMMIDVISSNSDMKSQEIADYVCAAVQNVNDTLGAWKE